MVLSAPSPPKLLTSPLRKKWGSSRRSPEKRAPRDDQPTTPRVEDGWLARRQDDDSDEGGKGEVEDERFIELEVLRHEATFGGEGAASRGEFDGLKAPMCMCPTPAGDICVADTGNHRLAVLSTRGELRELLGEGELRHPRGVACDSAALYVSEPGAAGRVQKMRLPDHLRVAGAATPRGSRLGELSAQNENDGPAQLTFPQGVALGGDVLYVADCEDHRVVAYDKESLRYLRAFGLYGDGDGELDFPYSVAAHEDEIFIADVGNHRISVFAQVPRHAAPPSRPSNPPQRRHASLRRPFPPPTRAIALPPSSPACPGLPRLFARAQRHPVAPILPPAPARPRARRPPASPVPAPPSRTASSVGSSAARARSRGSSTTRAASPSSLAS